MATSSCSCWRAMRTWGRMRESCSCSVWLTRFWQTTLRPCARTSGRHTLWRHHTRTNSKKQLCFTHLAHTWQSCLCSTRLCVVFISIQRYAVIPLSTNSGLIGWVPHCDTLHALIRDYREKKKILLNIEHRIMLRVKNCFYFHCLNKWQQFQDVFSPTMCLFTLFDPISYFFSQLASFGTSACHKKHIHMMN